MQRIIHHDQVKCSKGMQVGLTLEKSIIVILTRNEKKKSMWSSECIKKKLLKKNIYSWFLKKLIKILSELEREGKLFNPKNSIYEKPTAQTVSNCGKLSIFSSKISSEAERSVLITSIQLCSLNFVQWNEAVRTNKDNRAIESYKTKYIY